MLQDGTVLNLRDKRADGCVHVYRDVAGTAAVTTSPQWSALYDVTDPEITEYYDGMLVSILVPVEGNGSYGTALQINSFGYKPIVFGTSSMISTRYPVGGIILAQYNATQTAKIYLGSGHQNETVTGCWQVMDYNSDTTLIGRLRLERGSTPVVATTYREVLVCTNLDGQVVPLHSTPASASSKYSSTGTNKEMSRELFNPFGLIAYNATPGIIAAGGNIPYERLYHQTYFNPRYSLNCGETLVAAPLYLVAEPAEDGQARLVGKRPCWSQQLPTQYDGLIYILLGHHSGDTYSMLYPYHPVCWHNGDHICVWSGDENQAKDLAPVERGTLASQAYAGGDLMVTGMGLQCATKDIPANCTLAGKTEITTVAKELNKKVKRNELLERTRHGIIVARAIPDRPRPGHRYFFTGNEIYVRTFKEPYDEVLSDAGVKWRNQGKTNKEPYVYTIESPSESTIVEIPAAFNIHDFLRDSSYRRSMLRDASYLTTMETASPYFKIDKGRLVCVKRPEIRLENGKLEVLDRIKIRRLTNANYRVKRKIKLRGNGALYQKRLKWRPRWHCKNANPDVVVKRNSKSRRWTPGTDNRRGSSTYIVRGVARGRKSVEFLKFHEDKLILDGDIYVRTQLI